jgi:phage/plasmid-like protein (TIGR03299 family)
VSGETLADLNKNILIGFTEKRGTAWWYRADMEGDQSNHYPGAVPIDDVASRLFNWTAMDAPVYSGEPVEFDAEGNPTDWVPVKDPDRKYIIRSDTHARLGLVKKNYQPHQPMPWLVHNIGMILDDDVMISSAGVLDGGKKVWVECSLPENIVSPEGVEYRPNLFGLTSFDASTQTTYGRNVTMIVCDNTLAAAVGEDGQKIKVKHTANSNLKIADAREALEILFQTSDDVEAFLAERVNATYTDGQWNHLLELAVPINYQGAKRGVTEGEAKRDELDTLYRSDERCAPWVGTEFGVYQTFNTWFHHCRPTKKATDRGQRNIDNAMSGATFDNDNAVLKLIAAAR